MHRAILEACLPCLAALAVGCAALALVVRLSGCRPHWKRLRQVHACQDGGVQSLAFVLTLPLFIVIVQFIVQVSQLMIGTTIVNYSAFAAARAASVWIPAYVEGEAEDQFGPNRLAPIAPQSPVLLTNTSGELGESEKHRKIFTAAVMACAPICPSRNLGLQPGQFDAGLMQSTERLYSSLAPGSLRPEKIRERTQNKIAYGWANTQVLIEFEDKNSGTGPTYNPLGHPTVEYIPHEVGWQDPVTVRVFHRFALLPGPGRVLARHLVRADGLPDHVSPRIDEDRVAYSQDVYSTLISASATITNEGLKPVRRPVQGGP